MKAGWSVLLAGAVVTAAGCASSGTGALTPSATVTTATQGWEHYFTLNWKPESSRNGVRIVGEVENQYGRAADRMQLLAQAFDAGNQLIAQKLVWVPETVPPTGDAYFVIDKLPPADHYRVTVWSWNFIEGPGRRFP